MDKNKEIAIALGKIINGYGIDLLKPTPPIKGLLMDIIPKYSRERALIMLALSCGVGLALYRNRECDGKVSNRTLGICKRSLLEMYVSEDAADMVINWIVDSFNIEEALPPPKKHNDDDTIELVQDFQIDNDGNKEYESGQKKISEADRIARIRFLANSFLSSSSKGINYEEINHTVEEYDFSGKIMLRGDSKAESYIFDEKVEIVGEKAFANTTNLVSVTFTNNITTIEREAFSNCTALTNIVLLRNIKTIGNGVFKGCKMLATVSLPANLEFIPSAMFKKCVSLKNINIPSMLKEIGDESFRECSSLLIVHIPDSVISIGNRAFLGCKSLQNITLGKNIKNIGRDAFVGCSPNFCVNISENINVVKYCILHHINYKWLK